LASTGPVSDSLSSGARRLVATLMADARATGQPVCLDRSALVDFVARAEPVRSLLSPLIRAADVPLVISTVTLAKLVTRPARTGDLVRVRVMHAALLRLPGMTVVDLDQDHAVETARVHAETGLRLPDAAIIATARRANASA
jgi:PIN domain nuclease of toxin-antitoxin system